MTFTGVATSSPSDLEDVDRTARTLALKYLSMGT